MRKLVPLLLLILIPGSIMARDPKTDSETGRIRILYVGDAWGPTPYFHMIAEPSFVATPVPATEKHIGTYSVNELRQFMRVYIPRTYRDFTSKYDLLILSDTNRGLYRNEQLEWFKKGVYEEGIGIAMVGGVEAFGGDGFPTWGESPVEDALPVVCMAGETFRKDFKVVAKHPEDPFIRSLPWKTMPFFHGMNVVAAKEGSKVLLEADLEPLPILAYWEYGRGSGLAHMPDWTPAWGSSIMSYWDYYSDYVANLNYLNAGVLIPQNAQLMHEIRNKLRTYVLSRAMAISLMEFVEKFGARVSIGEQHLTEIATAHKEAEDLFTEQDYEGTLEVLRRIEDEFEVLSDELVELKERALLWIYVVEWFTVSGTAVITGVVLWTLMVRRRLYKEVSTTRAQF